MSEQKLIVGQFTNSEFQNMFTKATIKGVNYTTGIHWIKYGKKTTNYFIQHSDGSWTNFNCVTSG